MTSPGQPVQPSEVGHEPSEDAREPSEEPQQPGGRFSLPPCINGWLWITLSVIAFVGLSAALIAVALGSGTHQATLGGPSLETAPGTTATTSGSTAHKAPNGIST
jgi:hypothetical protein